MSNGTATAPTGFSPVAMTPGEQPNTLWVTCSDGSLWYLAPNTNPHSSPAYQDPTLLWTWTKLPGIPGAAPPQPGDTVMEVKIRDTVATASDLPATGNVQGDLIITTDTGDGWMWNGTDWENI